MLSRHALLFPPRPLVPVSFAVYTPIDSGALSLCARCQRQEWDNFGSPHLGVAKIAGEEVANGVPIEKRWLRLKHRTGRPSNFGKARLLVSVDFDPVGPVRHSTPFKSIMEMLRVETEPYG